MPAHDARVLGELYEVVTESDAVIATLDEIEGHRPELPDASLYTRLMTPVSLTTGQTAEAWVYFYNAPLGGAQRIESGDYLEHLKMR